MCGIAGFQNINTDDKKGLMSSMLKTIHHRGPDDQNQVSIDNTTLGYVRLAIIDIEHGQQPVISPDNRYTLVFNGEIYNYVELRQQLISKGYPLKSYSDSEVLLYAYIEFGKDVVNVINGMFAFALYDKIDKSIFIARDHFGIKPLFYSNINDQFIFASEIKSLLQHEETRAVVDEKSLYEYLNFQLVLKKHTLFKDIFKLEPATYLIIQQGKIIEKKEYWKPNHDVNEHKSLDQFTDELLVLLENSLSIQVRSDVPVGAYLSGGLDSSTIAVLASKNYFGRLKTFSGGFNEGKAFDETHYADIVSKSINSEHYKIFPEPKDFIDNFEKMVYHMDEPAAGPGLFPQYMVSKLASEHVKVVLGGQGGDEIFGGYARYAVAYLEECLKGAIFETQEEDKYIVSLSSIIPNLPILKQYVPMIQSQFSTGLFESMDRRYYKLINRSPNLGNLYNQSFLDGMDIDEIFEKYLEIFNEPSTDSYFNKMTNFDMKTLLPSLLQVEDRMSMAVSLESRVPLLDRRIVELIASAPPNMKFAGGKTKFIFLNAVKNILPKEIVQRKDKLGFPVPFNQWLKGPLKEYVLDIFSSKKAKERGLYDYASIEKQILKSGAFSRDLWGALNIEVWHQQFID